jgi:hypothetical protein
MSRKPKDPTKASKKNPAAVMLGRLGGLKGGRARAEKLTPEQLSESGRKAVMARWAKAKALAESKSDQAA